MKVYGYTQEQVEQGVDTPSVLSEVTCVSNPEELRKFASYLSDIAAKLEEAPEGFEHEHLDDNNESLSETNFVVFNEDAL